MMSAELAGTDDLMLGLGGKSGAVMRTATGRDFTTIHPQPGTLHGKIGKSGIRGITKAKKYPKNQSISLMKGFYH